MRPLRRITAVAVLLGLLAGQVLAAPAVAAPVTVRMMAFNVCGNVCRGGEVRHTTRNLAYQITARRIDLTFLQEICYSQFLALRGTLRGKGFQGVFASGERGGRCDDHDRAHGVGFGNAVLVRGTVSGKYVRRLPSPASVRPEGRIMVGTKARIRGRTTYAFATHTAPGGPNLAAQLRAIRAYAQPLAGRQPLVLGGDLNVTPGDAALDGFYSSRVPRGRGVFREIDETTRRPACRCGSPTFRSPAHKIDYIFAGQRHFRPRGAVSIASRWSDHRMLIGAFALY